jgi:cell division protein FtsN
MIGYMCK